MGNVLTLSFVGNVVTVGIGAFIVYGLSGPLAFKARATFTSCKLLLVLFFVGTGFVYVWHD